MATTVGYIAATVPAKIERVSHTTLFHVAMFDFGNALQWTAIASLNGMIDPWITSGRIDLKIPPTLPSRPPTGILGQ
jgi:hypothetical protein